LDEVDLVPGGFELADGFIIIKQAHVDSGKVALIQHLGNFFPFKGAGTHDGNPKELSARRRRQRSFGRTTHEVCEASL
jgi:hypothetical protein